MVVVLVLGELIHRGDVVGADVELANSDHLDDLRRLAQAGTPESTLRRIQAVMRCRERVTTNVAPLLAAEELTISLVRG